MEKIYFFTAKTCDKETLKESTSYFYWDTTLFVILLVFGVTMAWYWKLAATHPPPAEAPVENLEIQRPIQEECQDKEYIIQKIPTED